MYQISTGVVLEARISFGVFLIRVLVYVRDPNGDPNIGNYPKP